MTQTPLNPDYDTFVRETFSSQGMMHTIGAEISGVSAGRVIITAPVQQQTSQQDGFAHAGLGWTIGDSAAGFAALSLMGAGERVLTVEMKTNLMAPAQGERLVAEGRVLRFGGRICTVASDVYAEGPDGRVHIATMLGTMARLR
ncbi:MAG: PaaI family thioesterase [Rhodobacteraceae bacterium]|nr:PaaI family thioesterase [Paracoccaceae bacterium]